MKLLRVLTGFHTGAKLNLKPGSYRLSSASDADIQLTDWQEADVFLHVTDDGVVSLSERHGADISASSDGVASSSSAATDTITVKDFVPLRFGELVLCVGPLNAKWPSDVELLATALARAQQPPRTGVQFSRQLLAITAACVLLGTVAVTALLMNTAESSRASTLEHASIQVQEVSNALAAAHLGDLHARAVGKTIVVSGMVLNDSDDRAARRILAQFPEGDAIECNYDIAQQVTSSIGDMLNVDGAYVTYLGDGNFVVNGPTIQRRALQTAIARARDDLSLNVAAVELHTSGPDDAPKTQTPAFSEMLASESVHFAQTPDGVKHVFSEPNK